MLRVFSGLFRRLYILVLAITVTAASGQTIWYVDDSSTSGLDCGTDWENAYVELQSALILASTGDEIRVAQGIYKPDRDAYSHQHTGDRYSSFLLYDEVVLRGGYAGYGSTDPDARDVDAYKTVLSGDLAGDDGPNFVNNGENSYHVIVAEAVGPDCILDGFTVTGGHGNEYYLSHNMGGGMLNQHASPTIRNCSFTNNTVTYWGGGMCNDNGSTPTITNCRFTKNSSSFRGGGIANYESSPVLTNCECSDNFAQTGGGGMDTFSYGPSDTSPSLTNCTFRNNATNNLGGGMFNDYNSPAITNCVFIGNSAGKGGAMHNGAGSPTVKNCIFRGNSAVEGGGAYNERHGINNSYATYQNCAFIDNIAKGPVDAIGGAMRNDESNPTLQNCTFSGNSTSAIYGICGGVYSDSVSSPILTNCILWGNTSSVGSIEEQQIYAQDAGNPGVVRHCCVQGLDLYNGNGNVDWNPELTADGIHLQSTSPCLDHGDPFGDYSGQTDIDQEIRLNDSCVDIGADEFIDTDVDGLPDWWENEYFDSPTAANAGEDADNDGISNLQEYLNSTAPVANGVIAYVSTNGNDEWDGLSPAWDGEHGPKATIQAAIDSTITGVVIIQPGTYTGSGNRDLDLNGKTITVRGTDPTNSIIVAGTIIDCQGSESEPHRGFWFHNSETSDSALSGVTICNGFVESGGAVLCESSSPTITNCVFRENTATLRGGGLCNLNSNPILANCVFRSNSIVSENTHEPHYGGGIYNHASSPTLANCLFIMNWIDPQSDGDGGGIANECDSNPTLVNCVLWGNRIYGSTNERAQIYSQQECTPIVQYCCIQGLDSLAGNGNFDLDPGFTADYFHLTSNSPCVDQGDSSHSFVPPTDIDGDSRSADSHVDVGPDEFVDTDNDDLPDWWEIHYFDSPTAASPDDDPNNDGRDNLEEYAAGSNPFAAPATYYVSLTGDDSWDGLNETWNGEHGPKATIQAGIDAADPFEGDEVVILPGIYTGPGNRDLDFKGKAITVRSSAPENSKTVAQTVIDCEADRYNRHRGFLFHNLERTSSVLNGVTIRNGAADAGGGILCEQSDPSIINCRFLNNKGSGLHNYSSSPTISNCVFQKNFASAGGGIRNEDNSNAKITNCIFNNNSAGYIGGGLYNIDSNPVISNCTFTDNTGLAGSGIANYQSSPFLQNSIIWGNKRRDRFDNTEQIYNSDSGSNTVLRYCCIQEISSHPGNGNIGDAPLLTADNMHLQAGSPCINAGNPYLDCNGQIDLDGESRTNGQYVDIGADEFFDTDLDELPDWWEQKYYESPTGATPDDDPDEDGKDNRAEYVSGTNPYYRATSYFVSPLGDDSWDGLYHERNGEHGPKRTIQAGIDVADALEGDTVIIAPGVYTGSGNRDLSFKGKAITVSGTDPTNPSIVSQTVIDCEGTDQDNHRGFLFNSFEGHDSVLYGITIRKGYESYGGAVSCNYSNPTINNCRFIDNTGSPSGGGISTYYSRIIVKNSSFINNYANTGGGLSNHNGSTLVENCLFEGNTSIDGGGFWQAYDCTSIISNCRFNANSAIKPGSYQGQGGGFFTDGGSSIITNCAFSGNETDGFGAGIYNIRSDTSIINCTLFANTSTDTGGGIYSQRCNNGPSISNSIFWDNTDQNGAVESAQIRNMYSTPNVSFSCIAGLNVYSGNENIGENPLFASETGLDGSLDTAACNLGLQGNSPCINVGNNTAIPNGVSTDLNGSPRIHACIVDMGAYEYQENTYFGDADENCVIDLIDYQDFSFCLERFGYERNPILDACIEVFDSDGDKDVDLADFAAFQAVFGQSPGI